MVISKKDIEGVTGKAADWVTSQSFNNILLLMILFAIGWVGWYGIKTAIPSHLTQIQTGYEKLNEANLKQIEAMDAAHRDQAARTVEIYDKWMSEITNRNNRSTPTAAPTLSRTP